VIRGSIVRLIATEIRASKNKTSNSNSTVSFTFKLLPKQIYFRKDYRRHFASHWLLKTLKKNFPFQYDPSIIPDFIISRNNKE